jgi:hypothetical protein
MMVCHSSIKWPDRFAQRSPQRFSTSLAMADIGIVNPRSKAKGALIPIMHLNAPANKAMHYHDIIITPARTVQQGIVDVEKNKTWDML